MALNIRIKYNQFIHLLSVSATSTHLPAVHGACVRARARVCVCVPPARHLLALGVCFSERHGKGKGKGIFVCLFHFVRSTSCFVCLPSFLLSLRLVPLFRFVIFFIYCLLFLKPLPHSNLI